jgi:hypothetical protein
LQIAIRFFARTTSNADTAAEHSIAVDFRLLILQKMQWARFEDCSLFDMDLEEDTGCGEQVSCSPEVHACPEVQPLWHSIPGMAWMSSPKKTILL